MPDSLYNKIANALDFRALFDISPVGFALNRLSNGSTASPAATGASTCSTGIKTAHATGRATVNAIIAMCKSLGLREIAGRIETTAQRDYLLQQGCTLGEGYRFAKPVPQAEFQRLLGGSFV